MARLRKPPSACPPAPPGVPTSPALTGLPEVATPRQLSAVIHMTEDALAQDRYRGRGIPYVKVGNRVRYLRSDVLKFLDANRVGGDAA